MAKEGGKSDCCTPRVVALVVRFGEFRLGGGTTMQETEQENKQRTDEGGCGKESNNRHTFPVL